MRRAIGIVRVSRVNGRDGESFASPGEQRERLAAAAERDGFQLVRVEEELDVSGGTPLEKRTGLRSAVEAVEAGEADVIVAAYFDRLVRSLAVQAEVVQRVEAAGGSILALDVGQVTEGTAGQWLSGTLLGAVSEYQRRTTAERSSEAQKRAVARGVPPVAHVPPGYRRADDGTLVIEPGEVVAVVGAFQMRADGSSIKEVCAHLRRHGIERSWRSTQTMLASRLYLGEIKWGNLHNPDSHEAIIERDLFDRVQRKVISRGRKSISPALLARQDVLYCGSCGKRMSAGSRSGKDGRYLFYRCSPTSDCQRRVAVSATMVEGVVVEQVREVLADVSGRASAEGNVLAAEAKLDQAQQRLDGAIRALADLMTEPSTAETLAKLQADREEAQAELDQLGGADAAISLDGDWDWDALTLEERRALIRATVKCVTIAPGKPGGRHTASTDRITVELYAE